MYVLLDLTDSQIEGLSNVVDTPFNPEDPCDVGNTICEIISQFEEFDDEDLLDPLPETYRDVTLRIPHNICGMFINYIGLDPDGGLGMAGYMVEDEEMEDGAEITLPYGPRCEEVQE